MFRYRTRDIATSKTDPKTGRRVIHFFEGGRLRRFLLQETFLDLVRNYYVKEYLKTAPNDPSGTGINEFIKNLYTQQQETTVAVYQRPYQQWFYVVHGYGDFYTIGFRYSKAEAALVYAEPILVDDVFDTVWGDINIIIEFVRENINNIPKERARLFKQYLMEDANDYANSNELKQEIKELFLPFAAEELKEQVRQDLLESIKENQERFGATKALEALISEGLSKSISRIVPYEEPRQTMLQPFTQQYGLRMWTTLYEKCPLPKKAAERIKMFLMNNFWSIFVILVPYEISSSSRLEEDIAAGNKNATTFKEVMSDFLAAFKGGILITQGGYGQAAYMVSKENLAWLYADERALKEVYVKYGADYPEITSLFKKMYSWTKDVDEQIELEQALRIRREKALKQYRYAYDEELSQEDLPPRRMLKKVLPPEDKEAIEAFKKEGYSWNQLKTAM